MIKPIQNKQMKKHTQTKNHFEIWREKKKKNSDRDENEDGDRRDSNQ